MCKFTSIPNIRRTVRFGVVSLAVVLGTFMAWPDVTHADDWGCQVMLCLSNPGGPEQYAECEPPIERLWDALRHGDPFPTCDFATGGAQGGSATNTFADASYCREPMLYLAGSEQSERMCQAIGAINAKVDYQLDDRVWRRVGNQRPTVTKFYGAGSAPSTYDLGNSTADHLQQVNRLGWRNR